MNILRSCEKEILDMTFRWFTSIPTFVAEQIHYVLDANDLTKLKMFKKRIEEKIAEAESRSMEKFAETNPTEHEDYRRINQQISFLSEAMKTIKNVMSPEKGDLKKISADVRGKSVDESLCQSLFSSDSDDDTIVSKKFKKISPVKSRKIDELTKKLSPLSSLPTKPKTFDADIEQLPSTQEIEKVFDKWKDSKDKKLETKRAEKRKRSAVRKSGDGNSASVSKNATSSIKTIRTSTASKMDDFGDDMDFVNISDSQLFGQEEERKSSVFADNDGDDSCSIVEETRFSAPYKFNRSNDRLESIKNYDVTKAKSSISVSSRFLDAIKTPKKSFDPKLPSRFLNSIANVSDVTEISRVPDTFVDLVENSFEHAVNAKKESNKSLDFDDSFVCAFDNTFEPKSASVSKSIDASRTSNTPTYATTVHLQPNMLKSVDRITDTLCSTSVSVIPPNADSTSSKFKFKAPHFNGNQTLAKRTIVPPPSPSSSFSSATERDTINSCGTNEKELSNSATSRATFEADLNGDLFDEIFDSQFVREFEKPVDMENKENLPNSTVPELRNDSKPCVALRYVTFFICIPR